MNLKLEQLKPPVTGISLNISGSKSESNRWLILQALLGRINIENLSDSDDTEHLKAVLSSVSELLDVGHAGTAMRFGTAFFAGQPDRNIMLTGSSRMKQRPIGVLVDALNTLGAKIDYAEAHGYPPLVIQGRKLQGGTLSVDGSISSQFLTALLLIAPSFEAGLRLEIKNQLTSRPYLEMTVRILQELGVPVIWTTASEAAPESIFVKPYQTTSSYTAQVESDWSSAGYWYSWTAFQEPGYQIKLSNFKEDSLQGDRELVHIYKSFGVNTAFEEGHMILTKESQQLPDTLMLDLTQEPDQAQTIFATCLGLGVDAHLTGLHTLKIKETDRIEAMREVGSRFRESEITTTHNSIKLAVDGESKFHPEVVVDTYQDHRMAMAFAPLVCKTKLLIQDAMVVTKSYKSFYKHLQQLNVSATEI